jgi:hypothetical protein
VIAGKPVELGDDQLGLVFAACCQRLHAAFRRLWLHEIKHDGFRIIAHEDGDRVRLYSRPSTAVLRIARAS